MNQPVDPSFDATSMPQPQTFTAFISYASPDRDKAHAICASLESRGLRCWIAPRDVPPGSEYGEAIVAGIRDSRCLVLVLSAAANASPMVRREVERAVSSNKPVFPVRIEEVLPARSLEFFVSATHWIDAWQGAIVDHADRLAKELLNETALREAVAAVTGKQRRRSLIRRVSASTLVVGIVAVLALIVALRSGRSSSDAGYDPVRAFAATQGMDIDDVSADDFRATATTRHGMNVLVVDVDDKLGNFVSQGMMQFRIGVRPWKPVLNDLTSAGYFGMLDSKDVEAGGPVEIQIIPNDGRVDSRVYGPFRLEGNVGSTILADRKSGLEAAKARCEADPWLVSDRGSGWRPSDALYTTHARVIRSIQFGKSQDALTVRMTIPRSAESEPSYGQHQVGEPVDLSAFVSDLSRLLAPLMRESELFGQLTYIDGTVGQIKRFDRVSAALAELSEATFVELEPGTERLALPRLSFFQCLNIVNQNEPAPFQLYVRNPDTGEEEPVDIVTDINAMQRLDQYHVVPGKVWGGVVPLGWASVQAKLSSLDGRTLWESTLTLPQSRQAWSKAKAIEPIPPNAVELHFAIEPEYGQLMLYPECPRGTVRVLAGHSIPPLQEVYLTQYQPSFRWESSWGGKPSAPLYLLFQTADGSEVGPVGYDVSPAVRLAQERVKPEVTRNRQRLVVALRKTDSLKDDWYDFQRLLSMTGLEQQTYSDWLDPSKTGVVILPCESTDRIQGWAAVAKVRYGPSATELASEAEVIHDLSSVVMGQIGLGGLPSGGRIPVMSLPASTPRVFVQYVLFDGSSMPPTEIPIRELK